MQSNRCTLFALRASEPFGRRVAEHLGVPLSAHEEREFDDGEHKIRPLVSVRGRHVVVIHALFGEPAASPNDKLCRLLFFAAALRDAGAARVTAVVPYLCYARKDRRTKSLDPLTLRYVAAMFETAGVDEVVTMDVHNRAAFENAFRCPTMHLEADRLFVDHFAQFDGTTTPDAAARLAVVSPDVGGVKRAEAFRERLHEAIGRPVASAFMEKRRSEGVVSGEMLVGEVAGRSAILYDDLIATGTTLVRAARACLREGAVRVYAAATHGLFVGGAAELLGDPSVHRVVVADTVPPFRLTAAARRDRVVTLDAAAMFAEAVHRLTGS